ncbi:ferritin [Mycolicibacterium fallax]|uniref:Bacterioferritin n=1 Tax=Mycolicibacterium fallax TaxID=1793 RepID=A0A1X1RJ59_MYCFA|nr:ferritin [Mycolicibacterium fallax]ORV07622.1 bacterioferritin [Mycolicibacterium fallax]BBY99333.1 ferritin BfrB [Mycolicibacterium fallax]
MPETAAADTKFHSLLAEQVRNEFTASQQYLAIAVHFDGFDVPQLAGFFYRQAAEERDHALMLVRYLLDRGIAVPIPGIPEVRNDFEGVRDAVAAALDFEREVTGQISALAAAARHEMDFLGEEFMSWFLKEQVEEVATMTTLLRVVDRANGNLFDVEDFVSREMGPGGGDPTAPSPAGAPGN